MKMIKTLLFSILIAFGMTACSVGDSAKANVEIHNSSSSYGAIVDVYIALEDAQNWGSDKLSGSIEPGETQSFGFGACDKYIYVKVSYEDYTERTSSKRYLSCGSTLSLTAYDY